MSRVARGFPRSVGAAKRVLRLLLRLRRHGLPRTRLERVRSLIQLLPPTWNENDAGNTWSQCFSRVSGSTNMRGILTDSDYQHTIAKVFRPTGRAKRVIDRWLTEEMRYTKTKIHRQIRIYYPIRLFKSSSNPPTFHPRLRSNSPTPSQPLKPLPIGCPTTAPTPRVPS